MHGCSSVWRDTLLSLWVQTYKTNKLRGLSPRVNYTDRETATCRRRSTDLQAYVFPLEMYLKQRNSYSSSALITSPGMNTDPSRLNYSLPCTVQKTGAWRFIATEIISVTFRLQCTCYRQRRRLMAFLIYRLKRVKQSSRLLYNQISHQTVKYRVMCLRYTSQFSCDEPVYNWKCT
jgi:hypothetical protein